MNPNPVALVTGATSGFGLETARLLSQKGYQVYGSYRNPKKLSELKRIPSVNPVYLDVTRNSSIKKAVSAILRKEGRIDVLVNNAEFAMAGFLEDLSDQD